MKGFGSKKYCYNFKFSAITDAIKSQNRGESVFSRVNSLLKQPSGNLDGLFLALLYQNKLNLHSCALEISQTLDLPVNSVIDVLEKILESAILSDFLLNGAEIIAFVLQNLGVKKVFVYPGTSELAICNSLASISEINLINARGDKECAFMTAGACLLKPNLSVGLLHGARGLTNALGAIADSRRNEVTGVFIVGLPSTKSSRFLPPHGEKNLMENLGNFVKWCHEVNSIPSDKASLNIAAKNFIEALYNAFSQATIRPYGPTMFGIPQDVAERAWIPWSVLKNTKLVSQNFKVSKEKMILGAKLISESRNVLILVDDFLLKYDNIRPTIAKFSSLSKAPVLQIRYRRGAMLFERLNNKDVAHFVGWFEPRRSEHKDLLAATDLLVTLEDRNLYRRVIGPLPNCRKLAITSDGSKTLKNEYLTDNDILLEGDVASIIDDLNKELSFNFDRVQKKQNWVDSILGRYFTSKGEIIPSVQRIRAGIITSLADTLHKVNNPVLVDDSQMFGGLVSEYYEELPLNLRVFGDHGGFIGSGIGYATGLAIAEPSVRVFCLLGDQGLTNGFQGLITAVQERAGVVFIVCNNGASVSLLKQSSASQKGCYIMKDYSYLENPKDFNYSSVAQELSIPSWKVVLSLAQEKSDTKQAIDILKECLAKALVVEGPSLIEICLPSEEQFWDGIWQTQGYDEFG